MNSRSRTPERRTNNQIPPSIKEERRVKQQTRQQANMFEGLQGAVRNLEMQILTNAMNGINLNNQRSFPQ
jgi:hypothetical protein